MTRASHDWVDILLVGRVCDRLMCRCYIRFLRPASLVSTVAVEYTNHHRLGRVSLRIIGKKYGIQNNMYVTM
jgi:hypothetical protein